MGQSCCLPSKDQNQAEDLRGGRNQRGDKKLAENPFKQDLQDPEFVVTRRDSLGMASKEHTQKMMIVSDSAQTQGFSNLANVYNTTQSDTNRQSYGAEVNTHGVNSQIQPNEQEPVNVYLQGTFAHVTEVSSSKNQDTNQRETQVDDMMQAVDKERNFSAMTQHTLSFGMKQELMDDDNEANGSKIEINTARKESIVSIRDIQEVRDKVPASPATQLIDEQKEQYFQ